MNLQIPYSKEYKTIIMGFIKKRVEVASAKKVLIGLSGGVDSSVVAKIVAEAVGKELVLGLIMPVKETKDTQVAVGFAEEIGIEYQIVKLDKAFSTLLNTYLKGFAGDVQHLPQMVTGNLSSRLRMTTLYFYANLLNGIVMGTSNKTELLTGYFTKYGDGGTDAMPLGDLYKTQVFKLAEELAIPRHIISKKPTAGFYKGQTDEDELGIDYPTLDKILYGIELRLETEEISESIGVESEVVRRIERMVQKAAHKRFLGIVAKVGVRTPGFDWRENIDFGLE